MQCSLGSKSLKREGNKVGNCRVRCFPRCKVVSSVEICSDQDNYRDKLETMSCQSNSEGSADGTAEGESCERGACEMATGPVDDAKDLISCCCQTRVLVLKAEEGKETGRRYRHYLT